MTAETGEAFTDDGLLLRSFRAVEWRRSMPFTSTLTNRLGKNIQSHRFLDSHRTV